jgi:hypothetical protein
MNPDVTYQMNIARIDELQRQAGLGRIASETAGARRERRLALSLRRWRAGREPKPSMAERFA